jgi:hypothetical protein
MIQIPINDEIKNSIQDASPGNDDDDMDSISVPLSSDMYEAYLLWEVPQQNYMLKYTTIDPVQVHSIVSQLRVGSRRRHRVLP